MNSIYGIVRAGGRAGSDAPLIRDREINLRRLAAQIFLCLCVAMPAAAQTPPERSAAELMDAVMWHREPVGGPFALIDHTGKRRTDADFRGKLMLVYFGFTYCPDVCPTDLQQMGLAIQDLGTAGEAVQALFITVDPARDTVEHLAQYVPHFHPRMLGLTGDEAAIRQAAGAYKAYYAKVPVDGGNYTIDHSAFIYLMDRDGKYLGFFPPGATFDRIAETLRPHVAATSN
jgi:cytochrome oxidase Cu insertion factor (SCO1/SenC/PrrC family)